MITDSIDTNYNPGLVETLICLVTVTSLLVLKHSPTAVETLSNNLYIVFPQQFLVQIPNFTRVALTLWKLGEQVFHFFFKMEVLDFSLFP